jgi:hypothetical protein
VLHCDFDNRAHFGLGATSSLAGVMAARTQAAITSPITEPRDDRASS